MDVQLLQPYDSAGMANLKGRKSVFIEHLEDPLPPSQAELEVRHGSLCSSKAFPLTLSLLPTGIRLLPRPIPGQATALTRCLGHLWRPGTAQRQAPGRAPRQSRPCRLLRARVPAGPVIGCGCNAHAVEVAAGPSLPVLLAPVVR